MELTKREIEIAQAAQGGASATKVGRILNLSANTVNVYLSRIYDKLELSGPGSRWKLAAALQAYLEREATK